MHRKEDAGIVEEIVALALALAEKRLRRAPGPTDDREPTPQGHPSRKANVA
jgi:hypothetical protein